jgi:hypothetical protein
MHKIRNIENQGTAEAKISRAAPTTLPLSNNICALTGTTLL